MDTQYLRRFKGGHSWYFRIKIPARLRGHYGGKSVIEKALGTRDLTRANILKLTLVAKYKREFAGLHNADPMAATTAHFREHFAQPDRDDVADEAAESLAEEQAERMVAEGRMTLEQARQWYAVATSSTPTLRELSEQWITSHGYSPNTQVQHRRAVSDLIEFIGGDRLPLQVADADAVGFFNSLRDNADAALNTKRRKVTALHTLWEYLIQQRIVPRGANLWRGFKFPRSQERTTRPEKRGYTPAELLRLFHTRPADDEGLADVMVLGLYSGARLEELCSLTADRVTQTRRVYFVRIAKAKTKAGIRTIAFTNPNATEILRRRAKAAPSPTSLLFPEFTAGGTGKSRYSYAVSKRFGTRRDALGFPREVDFHSFRRTVATVMVNKRVNSGHARGFVGHEGGTLLEDTYSDGLWNPSIAAVARALTYPPKVEAAVKAFCATR